MASREWRNGRRARLRIWSRKGWRFKSSLAHHVCLFYSGAKCTVQGSGKSNGQPPHSPNLVRFHELTEDEYFCPEDGTKAGVTFENISETEPLDGLRTVDHREKIGCMTEVFFTQRTG